MRLKVLFLTLAALLAVMVSGCAKKNVEVTWAPDAPPQKEETVEAAAEPAEEPEEAPEEAEAPAEEPAETQEAEPEETEAEAESEAEVAEEAEEPEAEETETAPEAAEPAETVEAEEAYVEPVELVEPEVVESELAAVVEEAAPAIPDILEPVASGARVAQNEYVTIDYSNTQDGYIMVLFTAQSSSKLKVQITGTTTTYTYNLYPGVWAVFPLTDGNGYYQFKVFQNVTGSQYALLLADGCDVALSDEFAPFLRPNQYVDYSVSSAAVAKAAELTNGISNPLEKVAAIYDYVVKTLSYDEYRAATVQSGYIPNLDSVLAEQKGICFDYAALMTGMLRSQGVPCKMIFGYAGSAYHAWINVWTEDTGWVDGVIFFDGMTWQRLDPTFASSANQSPSIMEYIGNGSNYTAKYMY